MLSRAPLSERSISLHRSNKLLLLTSIQAGKLIVVWGRSVCETLVTPVVLKLYSGIKA